MSTTIVFACKSNSCRSQMAEGWAQKWIHAERLGLENRTNIGDDDRQLRAFLDGLLVVSVALDESSISNVKGSINPSPSSVNAALRLSPTSSLTTDFAGSSTPAMQIQCVTCDGEMCTSSSQRRKKPKEKAVQAMSQDGVDISSYYAKTFGEILPFIADNHRRHTDMMCRVLETASRGMGMAFTGVAREEYDISSGSIAVEGTVDQRPPDKDETQVVVDNLIVLCSCPDSLKRQLSNLSKETLDWDIDPPTTAARSEGDGAFLRVSRQIREKVDAFMGELKRCAMMVDENDIVRCNVELNNSKISALALPLPVSTPW